jgi:hypothetical protein
MSDTMLLGVLRQPFEMALSTEWDRRQYWQRGKQAAAEIERLQDEVARLRKDAERYRWLRSSQTHKSTGCVEFGPWRALLNGPELDTAVDRGMLTAAKAEGHDE